MTRYFSSDFHFGHRGILEYCKRPFQSVEEMNFKLIEIWNATVKPDDEVFFLGDFSLNPKYSRDLVKLLNGNKILIAGNHDAPFPHKYNKKQHKMMQRYMEDGWKGIYTSLVLKLSDGYPVLLSHMPYRPKDATDANSDLRYLEHRPDDNGMRLLHGHLHKRYLKHGKMIDVGIDGTFKMYSEQNVIDLFNDPREFIPSELTQWYESRKDQNALRTQMKGL
jgi:calcineurin-like phosphoesterase family protein